MVFSGTVLFGTTDFSGLFDRFGIDWHLLVVQSLNFILVAFLLYRFGFRSVIKVMDERREKIESGLVYADRMKKEMASFESSRATRVEAAMKEADDIVKTAKTNAKTILEQGKTESHRMAENIISAAEKEIAFLRENILHDTKAKIGSLVVEVAKAVLAAKMTDEDRDGYAAAAEKMMLSKNLQ
ncbi:MAG: F0F1 ATP synthase subunit B [Puniceicoccales bacterium]|jgi:F-type H+-transporting ATPase subunit b|nr:F0F1 ATP synthase subunit B [Puniceicoccales bacterium]